MKGAGSNPVTPALMVNMKSTCKICQTQFNYSKSNKLRTTCSSKCNGIWKNKITVEAGNATPKTVRLYMLRHRKYECSVCNLSNWLGKDIKLQVDHIDGNVKNSLPSNLRWICPNCHSQTHTWGSNNIKEENRHKLKTTITGKKRIKYGVVA